MGRVIRLSVVVAGVAWGEEAMTPFEAAGFVVFKRGQGLPDYSTRTPFATEAEPYKVLWGRIGQVEPGVRFCEVATLGDERSFAHPLRSNICEDRGFASVRQALGMVVPAFDERMLSFWLFPRKQGRVAGVLITALRYSDDENFPYPYLGLWWLDRGNESNRPSFLGWYLMGGVHAIRAFGRDDPATVFIQHRSCVECSSWVYLTAFDTSAGAKPKVYGWNYSLESVKYGTTIEYGLPGRGHSVDAIVEVRIPPTGPDGPVLLQHFALDEGKHEWMIFRCKSYQCDFELFRSEFPPADYQKLWVAGEKL